VIVERYSEGDSFLHRLDPRIKICITRPYALVIALSNRIPVSLTALILSLVLLAVAGISARQVLKNLSMLFLFLALLWISLPLSIPGKTLLSAGPLNVSFEGLERVLSITIKSLAIVLFVIILLGTSTVFALVHGLSHLRFPKKLLYLAFLSYRYIHVVQQEYVRLRDAMKIRGFRPKTNLHTYRTFGYLIGMLLIRSFERSERIHQAMLCRGFHGEFYLLDHFHTHGRDILFTIGMSLLLTGLGLTEWTTIILP
jgi:cobalt/nickel transport system permease protein